MNGLRFEQQAPLVASDPNREHRGYGTALYEATRERVVGLRCKGLLLDVPPDDPERLPEPDLLEVNRRRMRFYERLGARPVTGTLYDTVTTPANEGYPTALLFDDLGLGTKLTARLLRRFVARLLWIKGDLGPDDERLQALVGLARPAFDYSFFQDLSVKIGQAPAEARAGLEALRDKLLELTAIIDQQTQFALR